MAYENTTLSYSRKNQGWGTFYSYVPDFMIGMNNNFYSFKGGNLYKHDSNDTRNNFYSVQSTSKVRGVLNTDPFTTKLFKTISLDGTHSWDCTVATNMSTGYMPESYFEKKEDVFYSYIRRVSGDEDLDMRSAQGLGSTTAVDSTTATAVLVTFPFGVDNIISVGDVAFKNDAGTAVKLGDITGISADRLTITLDTTVTGGSVPAVSDFVLYIKNSVAESYGAKGYYLDYSLENVKTENVELFSVGAIASKSFV